MTTETIAFRMRAGSIIGGGFTVPSPNVLTRLGDFFIAPRNTIVRVARLYGSFAFSHPQTQQDREFKVYYAIHHREDVGSSQAIRVGDKPLWIHIMTHQALASETGFQPASIPIQVDFSNHTQRAIKSKGARSNEEFGFGFSIVTSLETGISFFIDAVAEIEVEWIGGRGSRKNIDIELGFDELENAGASI